MLEESQNEYSKEKKTEELVEEIASKIKRKENAKNDKDLIKRGAKTYQKKDLKIVPFKRKFITKNQKKPICIEINKFINPQIVYRLLDLNLPSVANHKYNKYDSFPVYSISTNETFKKIDRIEKTLDSQGIYTYLLVLEISNRGIIYYVFITRYFKQACIQKEF